MHIRVYGKLRVSLAFGEYCTVFNPFNGDVLVKHQSCLNEYKNIFIVQSSKGFSARFSPAIIEIELLRYISSDAHNLIRSDFTHYANLMRF